jgi:salicylate synthetase
LWDIFNGVDDRLVGDVVNTLCGVYHERDLAGRFDPLVLVARLIESGLFDTYVVYERAGRWSFAGGVLGEVRLNRHQISSRWDGEECIEGWRHRPLDRVWDTLACMPFARWRAYGWLGFEYAYLPVGRADLVGEQPLLHLVVPHTEIQLGAHGVHLRSTSESLMDDLVKLLILPARIRRYRAVPVEVNAGAQQYQDVVARAIREIREGRFRKVILSRCLPVGFPVDLMGTYVLGRAANNPVRSFLVNLGGRQAVGFSPETVVEVSAEGIVSTQPLAGTRALRGESADKHRQTELLSDPKEIFEHAISVKQAYDELSTLCVPGSVMVNDLMTIKRRGSVQHLGSRVTGRLGAHASTADALEALFPAVTASGIPKMPAYDCIARLESQPRDLYAGAVLRVSSGGALDAALVLRTLFEQDGKAWLQAGAGIVADSTPAREFEETCEKLRSVAPYVVPASYPTAGAA